MNNSEEDNLHELYNKINYHATLDGYIKHFGNDNSDVTEEIYNDKINFYKYIKEKVNIKIIKKTKKTKTISDTGTIKTLKKEILKYIIDCYKNNNEVYNNDDKKWKDNFKNILWDNVYNEIKKEHKQNEKIEAISERNLSDLVNLNRIFNEKDDGIIDILELLDDNEPKNYIKKKIIECLLKYPNNTYLNKVNEYIIIPLGLKQHATCILIYESDTHVNMMLFNSGFGLNYHEKKSKYADPDIKYERFVPYYSVIFDKKNTKHVMYIERMNILIDMLINNVKIELKEGDYDKSYFNFSLHNGGVGEGIKLENNNTTYEKLYKYMKYINEKPETKNVFKIDILGYEKSLAEKYLLNIEYDKDLQNIYITDQKGGSCTYYSHILPLYYIALYDKNVKLNTFMEYYGIFYCNIIKKYVDQIDKYLIKLEKNKHNFKNSYLDKKLYDEKSYSNQSKSVIPQTINNYEILQLLVYYYNFIKKEENKGFLEEEKHEFIIQEYSVKYEQCMKKIINKNTENKIYIENKIKKDNPVDKNDGIISNLYNMDSDRKEKISQICSSLIDKEKVSYEVPNIVNPNGYNLYDDLEILKNNMQNWIKFYNNRYNNEGVNIYNLKSEVKNKYRILFISHINFIFENTLIHFMNKNDDYFNIKNFENSLVYIGDKNQGFDMRRKDFNDIYKEYSFLLEHIISFYFNFINDRFRPIDDNYYNVIQLILIIWVLYDSKDIKDEENINDINKENLKSILLNNLPINIYWINSNIFNRFYDYLLTQELKFKEKYSYFFSYNTFNIDMNNSNIHYRETFYQNKEKRLNTHLEYRYRVIDLVFELKEDIISLNHENENIEFYKYNPKTKLENEKELILENDQIKDYVIQDYFMIDNRYLETKMEYINGISVNFNDNKYNISGIKNKNKIILITFEYKTKTTNKYDCDSVSESIEYIINEKFKINQNVYRFCNYDFCYIYLDVSDIDKLQIEKEYIENLFPKDGVIQIKILPLELKKEKCHYFNGNINGDIYKIYDTNDRTSKIFNTYNFNLVDSFISSNFDNINILYEEFEKNYVIPNKPPRSIQNPFEDHKEFLLMIVIFNSTIKKNKIFLKDEKFFYIKKDFTEKVDLDYNYLNENMFYEYYNNGLFLERFLEVCEEFDNNIKDEIFIVFLLNLLTYTEIGLIKNKLKKIQNIITLRNERESSKRKDIRKTDIFKILFNYIYNVLSCINNNKYIYNNLNFVVGISYKN